MHQGAQREIPGAAAFLGVAFNTVIRWYRLGLIEGYQNPVFRGRISLYRDSVEVLDRQRKSQAPLRKG